MRRLLFGVVMLWVFGGVKHATGAIQWRVEDGGNGHSYEFVNDWSVWAEAKQDAELMSYLGLQGHLVTIASQEENEFIGRNVLQGAYTWIGLTDNEAFGGTESFNFGWPDRQTRGWVWVTGEPITYTNWGVEEPNNQNGEDFAAIDIHAVAGWKWNDGQAGWTYPYIVEYDTPANAVPEPSTLALCSGLGAMGLIATWRRRKRAAWARPNMSHLPIVTPAGPNDSAAR